MNSRGGKAFTLVEVLLAAGIAGIMLAIGIVPLVYTMRLIKEARLTFAADNTEHSAISRITLDTRDVVTLNDLNVVRLIHNDELEGPSDYLMLWTKTPSYSFEPAGVIVFGMPEKSVLGDDDYQEGLQRWTLSRDIALDLVTMDDLVPERAKVILPGVKGVRFSVLSGSEWVDEYSGSMPQALRILLNYESTEEDEEDEERIYDIWLPKF
jgi:hypothetical protein